MDYRNFEEEELQERILAMRRRNERIAARNKRRRIRKIRWFLTKLLPFCLTCLAVLVGIGFGIYFIIDKISDDDSTKTDDTVAQTELVDDGTEIILNSEDDIHQGSDDTLLALGENTEDIPDFAEDTDKVEHGAEKYYADEADYMTNLPDNALCTNGIFIDVNKKKIVMNRHGRDRIIPASMTKVLTLLVACEHVADIEATFAVSPEATWYAYRNDLSSVGFANEEVVSVKDLLYGTILPSGGDAAMALAEYVAGGEEAFVELMNEKVAELGLSETTHMTNPIGLYDENHYSTCYDIAIIMMAAMDNELCRQILSEHKYTTSQTAEHPQGIEISNWFLRRIEDKDCGMLVLGAKTGYVKESGHNAVSLAQDNGGNEFITVTINSGGNWKCIYDHVRIYSLVGCVNG